MQLTKAMRRNIKVTYVKNKIIAKLKELVISLYVQILGKGFFEIGNTKFDYIY